MFLTLPIFLLLTLLACRGYHIKRRTLRKMEVLLAEKDILMQEIHHRVKNNLDIIISLLESQSRYLNNPAVQAALRDTQNRIYAVFLLHQKLYGTTAGTEVNAYLYVTGLIGHLSETFDTKDHGVVITQKVDPASMDIDAAEMLPLAIIINETVTNAIKHAFPARRKGHIHLSLNKDASGTVHLQVKDNGVGFPFQLRPDDDRSLGLSLINGLVGQLHGRWTLENDGGAIAMVQFPSHHSKK